MAMAASNLWGGVPRKTMFDLRSKSPQRRLAFNLQSLRGKSTRPGTIKYSTTYRSPVRSRRRAPRGRRVSPTQGLFGSILRDSGAYARGPGTAAVNPEGFNLDWTKWGASPLKKNIDEGVGLWEAATKRNLFGESGIGGALGAGGSALARSGLMSSGAHERLLAEMGRNFGETTSQHRNQAYGEGLRLFGDFGSRDRDRAAGIALRNREIGSEERRGNLNRRQAGIDRSLRTRAGLFDTLTRQNQRQRELQYNTRKLPLDILMQLATGTPNQSSGSSRGESPLWNRVLGAIF